VDRTPPDPSHPDDAPAEATASDAFAQIPEIDVIDGELVPRRRR
jgi:hypothetical protein